MIGQALNTYATIGPGNAAHGGLKRILTSTGGIHDRNSANQQKLAPSTSSPSLDKIVGGGGGSNSFTLGGSNRSSSSLLSLSSFNINSVYSKVHYCNVFYNLTLIVPSFAGLDGFGPAHQRP